jgi:hypothetical protein
MGKVTSDDFLCGRKHSRISKCRKTRTKVRSKSGSKMGLASPIMMGPKRRNVHSTGLHGGRRNAKKGVKMEPKKATKFCPKWTTDLPRYSTNHLLTFEQFPLLCGSLNFPVS